ncbi:MAG: prevent-host-death protein [Gammaproteobacteria bacterium]|nr:MAG: prevent-host-death protein [Gammaproteobacteria bacterium]
MHITTREFVNNPEQATHNSQTEPVIITRGGKPRSVLLSYDSYLAIQQPQSKVETLFDCFAAGDPAVADIELNIPPRSTAQRPPVSFGSDRSEG